MVWEALLVRPGTKGNLRCSALWAGGAPGLWALFRPAMLFHEWPCRGTPSFRPTPDPLWAGSRLGYRGKLCRNFRRNFCGVSGANGRGSHAGIGAMARLGTPAFQGVCSCICSGTNGANVRRFRALGLAGTNLVPAWARARRYQNNFQTGVYHWARARRYTVGPGPPVPNSYHTGVYHWARARRYTVGPGPPVSTN